MAAATARQRLQAAELRAAPLARLAPRGAAVACTNPRVLRNYQRLLGPVVVTTVIAHLLTFLLILPVKIILLLLWAVSLGLIPGLGTIESGLHAVRMEAVHMVPLLVMLVFRTVYSSSLTKCFLETLEIVNPEEGTTVTKLRFPGSMRPKESTTGAAGKLSTVVGWMERHKVLTSICMLLLFRVWGNSGLLSFLAVPVSNFAMLWRKTRPRYAAALSALALVPVLRPLAFQMCELYRGSRVLSEELIEPYVHRAVLREDRSAFYRRYEPAMLAFAAPFYLLLRLPYLGPMTIILAQAAAAVLADHIAQEHSAALQETMEQDAPAGVAPEDGSKKD